MVERKTARSENNEVYGVYRMTPFIEEALRRDWESWDKRWAESKQERQEIARKIWGEDVTDMSFRFSPHNASQCLRWAGYEALGYKKAVPDSHVILRMMMGSSAHYSIARRLDQVAEGRGETRIFVEDPDMSGRLDYLLKNPRTVSLRCWSLSLWRVIVSTGKAGRFA